MKTTINVGRIVAKIETEGFGFNTVHRLGGQEDWQWHESVADMIASHHAKAMGSIFPCPSEVASTQDLNSSNDPDYRDDCLLGYPPVEPEWLPSPEEIDEIAKTPDAAAPTEDPSSGWVALRDEPTEPPREW